MKLFKKILLEYSPIVIYYIIALLIEVSTAFICDGKFYIKDPRYMITIFGVVICILVCIRKRKARIITASVFLFVHIIESVVFILIKDMAGQWFDITMFSLRGDAMGIIENMPVRFWFTMPFLFVSITYLILGLKYERFASEQIAKLDEEIKNDREAKGKKEMRYVPTIRTATSGILIGVFLVLNVVVGYAINGDLNYDKYDGLLHSNVTSKYNQYGATNNFLNEIYAGKIFHHENILSDDEVESYIYNNKFEGTDYFGVSKDNNVVTILGETFEWFCFMSDESSFGNGEDIKFVNGASITEAKLREIYPNLWKLYDEGYILTNYHAREKTDISEAYSIMGSYPIGALTHYDYANNNLMQSAPNVMREYYKSQGKQFSAQYYHDGFGFFYNRKNSMPAFGFDTVKLSEEMSKMNPPGEKIFNDYGDDGERNLDSEMVKVCADEMFPTDGRHFYTYITTITTHGLYKRQRDNLTAKGYYQKLYDASNGKMDVKNCNELELSLYTYMAAAMETDAAVGEVLKQLKNRGLENNTSVVIFGDHQAYYEGLSNYVKGINSAKQCLKDEINYMDLYRVPCMIYDKKLVAKATNNGENPVGRFNNKFSSSCDIVPTVLDMLGIKYYEDMYYGHSIFSDKETVVYSRGYGYFLDNYSYFQNMSNFIYINPIVVSKYNNGGKLTDEEAIAKYKEHIDEIATELTVNIKYVDNIYKTNMFAKEARALNYKQKLYSLNGWTL